MEISRFTDSQIMAILKQNEAGGQCACFIDILKVKYLNNIVEQDHRFIKKITKPMTEFKASHSASATSVGIETAHMISKGQFANN
jgi:transposase-like protein